MAISTVMLLLTAASSTAGPIIDMHVHADMRTRERPVETCPGDQPISYPAVDPVKAASDAPTVSCPRLIKSVLNADQLRSATIAELRKAGVVRAVLIGAPDVLDRWQATAPGLFVAATTPKGVNPSSIASRACNVRQDQDFCRNQPSICRDPSRRSSQRSLLEPGRRT